MILDRLEQRGRYAALLPGVAEAMRFLADHDPLTLEIGRHDLQGDRLYALVQCYVGKTDDQVVWESHRRYIDVQYVARGCERMGWCPLAPELTLTQPYDAQKDVIFYHTTGRFFEVAAGDFAVFFPSDVHAPGLRAADATEILKVVVKVALG